MSGRRPEFFGSVQHGTDLSCGYDGGYEGSGICGKTATTHVWPGSPPDRPDDHCCWACDEHAAILYSRAWDWHAVGGACGIPNAQWYNGAAQGLGLCRHDLDDETLTVALAEGDAVRTATREQAAGVIT